MAGDTIIGDTMIGDKMRGGQWLGDTMIGGHNDGGLDYPFLISGTVSVNILSIAIMFAGTCTPKVWWLFNVNYLTLCFLFVYILYIFIIIVIHFCCLQLMQASHGTCVLTNSYTNSKVFIYIFYFLTSWRASIHMPKISLACPMCIRSILIMQLKYGLLWRKLLLLLMPMRYVTLWRAALLTDLFQSPLLGHRLPTTAVQRPRSWAILWSHFHV